MRAIAVSVGGWAWALVASGLATAAIAQTRSLPSAPAPGQGASGLFQFTEPPSTPSRPKPPQNIPASAAKDIGPLSLLVLLDNKFYAGAAGLRRVRFREEALQPEYFTRHHGGSSQGDMLVNCDARVFQLETFTLYRENNLAGGVVWEVGPQTDWRSAPPTTVLGRAVKLACGSAMSPPSNAAVAARTGAAAVEPEKGGLPAQEPSPRKSSPSERPTKPGRGWEGGVQIAASTNRADVETAYARLQRREPELMRGRAYAVVSAKVDGKVYYRALVRGFADKAEANAFCRLLAGKGHACLLRG